MRRQKWIFFAPLNYEEQSENLLSLCVIGYFPEKVFTLEASFVNTQVRLEHAEGVRHTEP